MDYLVIFDTPTDKGQINISFERLGLNSSEKILHVIKELDLKLTKEQLAQSNFRIIENPDFMKAKTEKRTEGYRVEEPSGFFEEIHYERENFVNQTDLPMNKLDYVKTSNELTKQVYFNTERYEADRELLTLPNNELIKTLEKYKGELNGSYQTLWLATSENGNFYTTHDLEAMLIDGKPVHDFASTKWIHITNENHYKITEEMLCGKREEYSVSNSNSKEINYQTKSFVAEKDMIALPNQVGDRYVTELLLKGEKGEKAIVFSRTDKNGNFKPIRKGEKLQVTYNVNSAEKIKFNPFTGSYLNRLQLEATNIQLAKDKSLGRSL